jgi:hypothetical protein
MFVQSGDKILKEICHLEFHLHLLNKLVSASVKKIPIPILKQVCGGWNQA